MYFICSEEDLIGKEISFTHMAQFADCITIVTKDKGIMVIEQDTEEITIHGEHFARKYVLEHDWLRRSLHEKGIITAEQITEHLQEKERQRKEEQERYLRQQEEQERKTYERLKAKFETR